MGDPPDRLRGTLHTLQVPSRLTASTLPNMLRITKKHGECPQNTFGYPRRIWRISGAWLEGTRNVRETLQGVSGTISVYFRETCLGGAHNNILAWSPRRDATYHRSCSDWFSELHAAVFQAVVNSDLWEEYWVLTECRRVPARVSAGNDAGKGGEGVTCNTQQVPISRRGANSFDPIWTALRYSRPPPSPDPLRIASIPRRAGRR